MSEFSEKVAEMITGADKRKKSVKEKVIEITDDLRDQVRYMREEGDADLRTVLYCIDMATDKINDLGDE